jgi:hypothetical protein
MIGGSVILFQSDQTTQRTDERQSQRQEEVLAREIARSGYSALIARTRQLEAENPNANVAQLVQLVDTLNTPYQGGGYTAWIEQVSAEGYRAETRGNFGGATHRLKSHWVTKGTLEVTQPSNLEVTFLESATAPRFSWSAGSHATTTGTATTLTGAT